MKINTTRFQLIEVDDKDVYAFPEGLLGFDQEKQFVILNNPKGGPFMWLQSCATPSLAFIVADPMGFRPDYNVQIKEDEVKAIGLANPESAFVMVILTVLGDTINDITANLMGPLVFNPDKMLAKQLVLTGTDYGTKHPVFSETSQNPV